MAVAIFVLAFLYLFYVVYKKDRFPPGPWGVPILGYLPFLGSEPHIKIGQIGKKYGNVFSLSLGAIKVVVLNDVESIKNALKMETFQGRPNHLTRMSIAKGGIVNNTGDAWKEQRRFSLSSLRDFGFGKKTMDELVMEDVQNLIEYYKKNGSIPSFPRQIFQVSVLNSLWSILTGEKYSLEDPAVHSFQKEVYEAFIEPPVAGVLNFLPWAVRLFPNWTGFTKLVSANRAMEKKFKGIVDKNASTYTDHVTRHFCDAYWKKVLDTKDPESSFNGKEGEHNFRMTLTDFFVAGSDTLSSTLSWAVLYLTTYPEICNKLYNEISEVVGGNQLPSLNNRNSMPYTEATMSEVLRMSSIVPGAVIHDTIRTTEFQGYLLPKGTIIMPNLHAVHHNKTIWGDPENFRPERFLKKNVTTGEFEFQKSGNLIPFSTGKRVCIAEGMAMMEFFLYLTGIVQNFKFCFDTEKPKPSLESNGGLVLAPKNFYVSFIPRIS